MKTQWIFSLNWSDKNQKKLHYALHFSPEITKIWDTARSCGFYRTRQIQLLIIRDLPCLFLLHFNVVYFKKKSSFVFYYRQ